MCNIWISELTPSFKLRNRRFTNNEMSVFQTRIKEILVSADSFSRDSPGDWVQSGGSAIMGAMRDCMRNKGEANCEVGSGYPDNNTGCFFFFGFSQGAVNQLF